MMNNDSDHIAEQAADYFVQRPNETPAQRGRREAWLAADARHRDAYQRMERLWSHAGHLRDDGDLQALKTRELAAVRRERWFRSGHLLAAALLALALFGGMVYGFLRTKEAPPPVSYATRLGEQRTEVLEDGSRIVLNTDSTIAVRYVQDRRDVELQRGEAQFDVAHDAARPFTVRAGEGTVTALGTRFQVRRDADATIVTLLQGKVDVAQGSERRVLQPNEQARFSAAGIRVATIDPAQVSGWLEGWLRFRNTSLADVVAEANRYSARKLRLDDPALADIAVSGNFHAGDSASIASTMALILPVRVDDSGQDIVLLPKKSGVGR